MPQKTMQAEINASRNNYDLLIERDGGNPVLILMGKNRQYWERLKLLCEVVIEEMEITKPVNWGKVITVD